MTITCFIHFYAKMYMPLKNKWIYINLLYIPNVQLVVVWHKIIVYLERGRIRDHIIQ